VAALILWLNDAVSMSDYLSDIFSMSLYLNYVMLQVCGYV